jgi:tetratricopeptide (TPR) repeat protein
MSTLLLALWLAGAPATGRVLPPEETRRQAVEHYRAGDALLRGERYEEAAEEFRTAVQLDPLLLPAHYNLGQAYMALKRYVEAVHAYRACEDAVARLNTVGQKERERRDRETVDEIAELKTSLVQLQTGKLKYVPSAALIVRIEERIRLLENARFAGRDVLRVPAEVHLGLGSAYFRQNHLPEAERAYGDALRADRRLGAAHNNLAVLYMLTGRLAESRTEMEAAERSGFTVDARFRADLQAREAAAREAAARK